MDKRRKIMKGDPEYNKLNKVIKKKTRNDMRYRNTKLIKTVIEKNKNMKVSNTINTRRRHQLELDGKKYYRIHQLKDTNENITEENSELINITENFYKTLFKETIPKPLDA